MPTPSPVLEFQRFARACGCAYVSLDDDFGPISGRAYSDLLLRNILDPLIARHVRDAVRSRVPTRARCDVVYGPIQTKDRPDGWCDLLNPSWLGNLRTIELPTALCRDKPISIKIHKKAAGAFQGLMADAAVYLADHPNETWRIFDCCSWPGRPRHIGRDVKRNLSRHSWACAFDVNPVEQHKIPEWFFNIARLWGWTCGADWAGKDKDEMHLELLRKV